EKYDSNGKEINYNIKEIDVDKTKYETTTIEDGYSFKIINKNIEKISVPVKKEWKGSIGEEVTINLLKGEEIVDSIKLSAENNWEGKFENLFKYDQETGAEAKYTVQEAAIDGYDSQVTGNINEGFTVTNTSEEKISIPVQKKWVGNPQEEVTINLLKDNDEVVKSVTLSSENSWKGEFKDVLKYDQETGEEIKYTVQEASTYAYTSQVTGNIEEGFTVTNISKEEIAIPVTKKWIGKPQEEITINLIKDDKEIIESIKLSAENNWEGKFEKLLKYDQETGEEIKYTVEEVTIDGYTSEVTGSKEEGFTVINKNIEKISIPVQKNWIGSPEEEVTINLLKYNNEVVKSIKLSAENNWKGEFEDLFKYDQETGKEIDYSIKEEAIEGYTSVYTGDKEVGFTVTNTITGKVSIGVTKEWVGKNSDEAKVTLLKNAEELETVTLNKGNNWQHTFENLEKYDSNGKEINYNIKEIDVDKTKYETTTIEDGYSFKIINKNIEKISVPVKKEWKGSIGEEVTINLLKGEEIVDSIKLSAENNW